jgi:hypothetical protein
LEVKLPEAEGVIFVVTVVKDEAGVVVVKVSVSTVVIVVSGPGFDPYVTDDDMPRLEVEVVEVELFVVLVDLLVVADDDGMIIT